MRLPDRLSVVHASLVIFALAILTKAGYEQVVRHSYWSAIGRRQHYASTGLPAPRGPILDAAGETLVESRELTRISVAPREVLAHTALAAALRDAGIAPRWIRAAVDTTRRWVDIPGAFPPTDVAPVVSLRGVYPRPMMDRVYARSGGIRPLVGRVAPDGRALDGIERALDAVLRGDTTVVRVPRDRNGRPFDAPPGVHEPEPGNSVVLTINEELQDICDRALASAVDSLHATGGDIVVVSPTTGDVLAMVSRRADPRAVANTAVTEPYEPGSTVKPFVAARLLALGRATPADQVNTMDGHITINGRRIDDADEHPAWLSLADVIKHSSNVGIVLFGERLTPREKFELLRDAGFGTPTGIPLPAESPGTLREPARWSRQSAASVVMGYEIAVTPLQLAMAYGAIANGGVLLAPHIVKEIRSPRGEVIYRAQPRRVRRIMPASVAATIRGMLRAVVASGTSTRADLATYDVAGKSGTARRVSAGRYERGSYTASFVGMFPEENPQYVILVKLDNPQGAYYGGVVAGSVTNVVLRAALAARDAALDLGALSRYAHAPRRDTTAGTRAIVPEPTGRRDSPPALDSAARGRILAVGADTDPRTDASYIVKLPARPRISPPVSAIRVVPDVAGLPVRDAVRILHDAGFRVALAPGLAATLPAAGTPLARGRVVRLGIAR